MTDTYSTNVFRKTLRRILFICPVLFCCAERQVNAPPVNITSDLDEVHDTLIADTTGRTLETRFRPPRGFERKHVESNSFAAYLRSIPLKPAGTLVKYYNGETKDEIVYDAVIDMDIGKKDLQQCADAIMRLRGSTFIPENSITGFPLFSRMGLGSTIPSG